MANVHAFPGDERFPDVYFDSSLPGGVIYDSERALAWNANEHPAVRAHALAAYEWALNGGGDEQPRQKAQYYYQLAEKKQLFGDPVTQRGRPYYGPQGGVAAARLRPAGARALEPVNDN